MRIKASVAKLIVEWTHEWNHEFHNAIEAKILDEYSKTFKPDLPSALETIEKMRSFYYARIVSTAGILIGSIGVLVAVVALFVALISLSRQV